MERIQEIKGSGAESKMGASGKEAKLSQAGSGVRTDESISEFVQDFPQILLGHKINRYL